MTTLDSSSTPESSMEELSNYHHQTPTKKRNHPSPTTTTTAATVSTTTTGESEQDGLVDGDPKVWEAFNNSFRQVQSVLDRNRLLIQQVNENHRSRIPDKMVKNVSLIQEINGNISKVVGLYSDLSTDFSSVFHQRSDPSFNGKSPKA
ncbi:protein EARLY FLOWERING 4 [Quillaja saponaria]|uniref:Protein EARLY FLOWERING 4 n=1 Tax=Quillaja saponaria TaxID=32244 RepID=A0AAD7PQP2_QUISA|nr:protein EARLY FLOWERING 4 [Quillaja saponaria]